MDVDRQEITVAKLLSRYAAGERDFTNVDNFPPAAIPPYRDSRE